MGLQNICDRHRPGTGEKTVNPAVEPEAGKAKLLCPAAVGARNWPATSLNPATGRAVRADDGDLHRLHLRAAQCGGDRGGRRRHALRAAPAARQRTASSAGSPRIDLDTREVVWTQRQRMPDRRRGAGHGRWPACSTATWTATSTRYDQATGERLWKTRLNAAPESSPITYAVDGRQYVAVVAGGGSAFGGAGRGLVPELVNPAAGITLYVFELPRP